MVLKLSTLVSLWSMVILVHIGEVSNFRRDHIWLLNREVSDMYRK